jgi:hypothetical protein
MINEDAINFFIAQVSVSLGFLARDCGFDPPLAEIDRQIRTATVTFKKGDLGIEANYDLRENDISVMIVRLLRGRKPDGYYVDQQGRPCRATLVDIFLSRGVRAFGLRPSDEERKKWCRSGNDGLKARMRWLLNRYASLLQEYGQDILSGSIDIFKELDSQKKSGE